MRYFGFGQQEIQLQCTLQARIFVIPATLLYIIKLTWHSGAFAFRVALALIRTACSYFVWCGLAKNMR